MASNPTLTQPHTGTDRVSFLRVPGQVTELGLPYVDRSYSSLPYPILQYLRLGQDNDRLHGVEADKLILLLYGGPKILYLFDYGDEWWHGVELISTTERVTRASYPRVVKKQGKSPPQYPKL